ncbi:MAG: ferredoxin family protein [Thaumarchaeota archaeon]|nr:ferredoxin family protein [Candidatus Calditenuaceae archaeon]MDW8187499.1 ferredoxin family protein [Nitrososphaerota archaeon]
MVRQVDFKSAPIDPDFKSKLTKTTTHHAHEVWGEGVQRLDAEGKPYPTKLGIHGSFVAVDFDSCVADGACMDVCPVNVFEWLLNPGQSGSGKDRVIDPNNDKELWEKYRTDKSDPVRESDCIFCMACESACPVLAIKIYPP